MPFSFFNSSWSPTEWNWKGLGNTIGNSVSNFATLDPNIRIYTDKSGNQFRVKPGQQGYEQGEDTFTFGDFLNPIGEGENAMSIGQLGLGLYSALQQKKAFDKQLDLAKQNFQYQKNLTGANFQNQATNWGNQSLFQAQSLAAFNPEAGNQRVADLNAAFNQLNNAGNMIGVNNVVGEQQNQLQKYNQLRGVA